jgi:signal transduction histidine kinase
MNRRQVTRVAFTVIIVFVLAQVVWWIIFQRNYVERTVDATMAAWQADAQAAQASYNAARSRDSLGEQLLDAYPHLRLVDGRFEINPGAQAAYLEEQQGILRMFAFEGPFFVLVILAMLGLIYQSLRQERQLKKQQQNFLAAVTHEFKTPLATLRLLVETHQLRDLDPEKRTQYLTRMASELDRIERTSNQVLAAARLEEQDEPPALAPSDLRDVTEAIARRMRPSMEAQGVRLQLDLGADPAPVSLDQDAFALVLGNLLDNAVKYAGPEAHIHVRAEQDGNLVRLHVDDDGPGVPEGERSRVFERFYRSQDESVRKAAGTGLGLHLACKTIESMNGWLAVTASPEHGARFTVTLPRRVAAASSPSAAEGAAG